MDWISLDAEKILFGSGKHTQENTNEISNTDTDIVFVYLNVNRTGVYLV